MKNFHPVVSLCGLLVWFLGCLVFHLSFMFVMLFSSWIKIYFALCLIRSQCKFGLFLLFRVLFLENVCILPV